MSWHRAGDGGTYITGAGDAVAVGVAGSKVSVCSPFVSLFFVELGEKRREEERWGGTRERSAKAATA